MIVFVNHFIKTQTGIIVNHMRARVSISIFSHLQLIIAKSQKHLKLNSKYY